MGNDSNLSDARVSEVLDMLECSNLKQGLDTPLTLLTEEGTLLSKGQLQRLAIARAFFRRQISFFWMNRQPVLILFLNGKYID